MKSTIEYFLKPGHENTEETFKIVKEALASHQNIKKVILASTTGATAKKALSYFAETDVQLIVIPHQYDFSSKSNRFSKEIEEDLIREGHHVHYGTMLFHTDKLFGTTVPTTVANFLRCFSEGYKVCYEIILMAADGGLLETGEQVIAIAGTSLGADTSLIMQAASTQNLRKLRVNEILCKPLYVREDSSN